MERGREIVLENMKTEWDPRIGGRELEAVYLSAH